MPAVRTINLAVNNLSCPLHLAWSPDGAQIAILATLGDCTNQYTGGPELAIFDARTGKLTHGYALDSVFTKQGISTKLASLLFAWAPDGSALIVAAGYDPYQAPPPGTPHGLISITVATGAVRFVADTTPQTTDGATLIWDTRTGKLIHTIAELAPATAYTWGADGSLAPSVAGAAGKGAVSIWRSGSISPIYAVAGNENTPPPANQLVPQLIVFISREPGWSPDGRYLALPLNMGVRLPGGANAYPNVGCEAGFASVCQSAPTAAPDKGFSAALAAFEASWSPSPQQLPLWNNQAVVWRADGQELVTLLPGQDFNTGKSTATLTIFNTHTGAVVRTLTINRVAVDFGYDAAPQVAWSPRGAALAALNYGDATLTLWRAE
jgi:WD40 repeat protein